MLRCVGNYNPGFRLRSHSNPPGTKHSRPYSSPQPRTPRAPPTLDRDAPVAYLGRASSRAERGRALGRDRRQGSTVGVTGTALALPSMLCNTHVVGSGVGSETPGDPAVTPCLEPTNKRACRGLAVGALAYSGRDNIHEPWEGATVWRLAVWPARGWCPGRFHLRSEAGSDGAWTGRNGGQRTMDRKRAGFGGRVRMAYAVGRPRGVRGGYGVSRCFSLNTHAGRWGRLC